MQADHLEHARQLENFYRLMFSLQEVEGVIMWGFWDQVRPGPAQQGTVLLLQCRLTGNRTPPL